MVAQVLKSAATEKVGQCNPGKVLRRERCRATEFVGKTTRRNFAALLKSTFHPLQTKIYCKRYNWVLRKVRVNVTMTSVSG